MHCCTRPGDYRVALKSWMLVIATIALLWALVGCKATTNTTLPVLVDAQFGTPADPAGVSFLRSKADASIVVGRIRVDGFVRLVDETTWLPLPLSATFTGGKVLVISRELDYSRLLDSGDPLPSWAASVFSPAELEVVGGVVVAPAFGLTFQAPQP